MTRPVKVLISTEINQKDLTLDELCKVLKQIAVINQRRLNELAVSSRTSYPALVNLLNGNNANPTVNTLDAVANELGFKLCFSLIEKRGTKGKK